MVEEYIIYQLPSSDSRENNWKFMSYDFATEHCDFDFGKYECVWRDYADEIDNENDFVVLERIFTIFNTNHPSDFQGHSLSVSDIVELVYSNGDSRKFYVNDIGYVEIFV